jgi:hypothetical protein
MRGQLSIRIPNDGAQQAASGNKHKENMSEQQRTSPGVSRIRHHRTNSKPFEA